VLNTTTRTVTGRSPRLSERPTAREVRAPNAGMGDELICRDPLVPMSVWDGREESGTETMLVPHRRVGGIMEA